MLFKILPYVCLLGFTGGVVLCSKMASDFYRWSGQAATESDRSDMSRQFAWSCVGALGMAIMTTAVIVEMARPNTMFFLLQGC